jgi:hypothetical protein
MFQTDQSVGYSLLSHELYDKGKLLSSSGRSREIFLLEKKPD